MRRAAERLGRVDPEGRLKRLRKSRLLTVRRLAEKAGVSPNTVWRMEHGKGAHPATISKVARALDVEPVELVKLD